MEGVVVLDLGVFRSIIFHIKEENNIEKDFVEIECKSMNCLSLRQKK
jgi:hypothetical protein